MQHSIALLLALILVVAGSAETRVHAQTPPEPTQELGLPESPAILEPVSTAPTTFDVAPATENVASPSSVSALSPRAYIPIVNKPGEGATMPRDIEDVLAYINYFRAAANVPLITLDEALNQNCWLHSRYMAEENQITHSENAGSKWYTAGGQSCAKNGNTWLGGEYFQSFWKKSDAVEGWVGSVGHRLWMLYPTTVVFGFGFYTAANNRAGSALDVLTQFSANRDGSYANWPVRFPGVNQTNVPATAYPITLGFPYSGPAPVISSVSLTANGAAIPNTFDTALPVSHKGAEIIPSRPFPANSTINVSVSGTYKGQPFTYAWSFKTGS